jgi:hypothetical protein
MVESMKELEQTLQTVLAEPQAAARGAIGYVGPGIPIDLLLATGHPSLHLPWRLGRATPVADRYLESSFPGWARSLLQDWADGCFDPLDCVVFSRGDDGAQRLYYYLRELRRRGQIHGPEPLIFDLALIPRASSERHTASAVRALAARFGVDDAGLRRGIAHANSRRALFAALEADRGAGGALYERIARASLFADCDAALRTALAGDALPRGAPAGRVLLAGSVPPDDRLHLAVDATGWSITGEAHEQGLTRLGAELAVTDATDPAGAIACHLRAFARGARAFFDRSAALLADAARVRADAVILWLAREDEGLAWHLPAQRAALAQAGTPVLCLAERDWDDRDAGTPIIQFIRSLESCNR